MGLVRPKVDRFVALRITGALLFSVLAACSTEESSPPDVSDGTYVGRLDGSDALVAVTVAGNDVVAYSCGGPLTIHMHTRWYRGTLDGDSVDLTSDDGATGTIKFAGDSVSGSLVQPDGQELALFETALQGSDTASALFSVVDEGCRTGVIVKQDSADVDAQVQGAWCGPAAAGAEEDIFSQVTPITPIEAGLTSLEIEVVDIDKQLTAVLVDPAEF
jgi:hypothetical protein